MVGEVWVDNQLGFEDPITLHHVERFFLRVVNNLDLCRTFPWERFAFDKNLDDVSWLLRKAEGVVETYKKICRTKTCTIKEINTKLGSTKDIESILEPTPANGKFWEEA